MGNVYEKLIKGLTNIVGNVYEQLIKGRMGNRLNGEGILSNRQYGFTKGRSTEDGGVHVKDNIKEPIRTDGAA